MKVWLADVFNYIPPEWWMYVAAFACALMLTHCETGFESYIDPLLIAEQEIRYA